MSDQFTRMKLLYGSEAMEILRHSRVAVFGIGGVGGYVIEALARSGIGALDLVDHDRVSRSNLNRQILAVHSSIGRYKVQVAEERIHDINPDCKVCTYRTFFLPETADIFDFRAYDYIVDAVDTVTAKLLLAETAQEVEVPIISAMGTGNKCHPELLKVADLYDTAECPLARIMRKEARKRGIKHLKVVWSPEVPKNPKTGENDADESETDEAQEKERKREIPGSTAFVPAAAGLMLAAEVVNDLTGMHM